MGGVDGDRGEQRVNLFSVKLQRVLAGAGVELTPGEDTDVFALEGGEQEVVPAWGLRPPSSGGWGWLMPSSMRCRMPATRISMNSSRLLAVMARNLTRSSRGLVSSWASSRTRPLKLSQESSRLKKSCSTGSGAAGWWLLREAVRDARLTVIGLGKRVPHLGEWGANSEAGLGINCQYLKGIGEQ
jgi:hypothetical protein